MVLGCGGAHLVERAGCVRKVHQNLAGQLLRRLFAPLLLPILLARAAPCSACAGPSACAAASRIAARGACLSHLLVAARCAGAAAARRLLLSRLARLMLQLPLVCSREDAKQRAHTTRTAGTTLQCRWEWGNAQERSGCRTAQARLTRHRRLPEHQPL
jgi:hypothetical protein